jgi:hypothetical protein
LPVTGTADLTDKFWKLLCAVVEALLLFILIRPRPFV